MHTGVSAAMMGVDARVSLEGVDRLRDVGMIMSGVMMGGERSAKRRVRSACCAQRGARKAGRRKRERRAEGKKRAKEAHERAEANSTCAERLR
eukprot:2104095-Rhodomonas_salina.2